MGLTDKLNWIVHFLRRRWITLAVILVGAIVVWNNYHIRQEQNKGKSRDAQLAREEQRTREVVLDNRQLSKSNRELIHEIQNSRLNSCRDTYEVIQTILRQSAQGVQLRDGRKIRFNKLLDLADPKRCKKQTAPKKSGD